MPINYNHYHPKWKLISRLIRYHRAHNKCEKCGAANGIPHPLAGKKVVLTVAHLDRDRRNNRFSNLAALCQWCHLDHDRCQHIFSRRFGRATAYTVKLFDVPPVTDCYRVLHNRKSSLYGKNPVTMAKPGPPQNGSLFEPWSQEPPD